MGDEDPTGEVGSSCRHGIDVSDVVRILAPMDSHSHPSPLAKLFGVARPAEAPAGRAPSRSLRALDPGSASKPSDGPERVPEEGIVALARMAIRRDIEPGELGHGSRVAILARAIAVRMNHDDPDAAYLSGLLHDVGKSALPMDPAWVPRDLTNTESELVRSHPLLGARIGSCIGVSLEVVEGILFHHERLDGSGYPAGLRGSAIPMISLIVGVADMYDALSSARPYKAAWPIDQVREYIARQAGRSVPRDIVTAVLDVAASGFDWTGNEDPR